MSNFQRLARIPGLTGAEQCMTLSQLAKNVPADQAIVEIGVYKARSLCYLSHGARTGLGAHVWGVDAWDLPGKRTPYGREDVRFPKRRKVKFDAATTFAAAKQQVRAQGMRQWITLVKSYSFDAAAAWGGPTIGLLHIDGDHHYDSVIGDFAAWRPHLADRATVVLDDYWARHPEVVQAVDQLVSGGALVLDRVEHGRQAITHLVGADEIPAPETPDVEQEQPEPEEDGHEPEDENERESYLSLTTAELRALAKERGVTLSAGVTRKADIADVIIRETSGGDA